MAENPESPSDFPIGELREITLLLPGEHFFCETLEVPSDIAPEDFIDFCLQALDLDSFSPFPPDQLAWGFHGCPKTRKILIFATPFVKLRQLGWQNLEYFRRVFPSFVSLVGNEYEKPSIVFLLHDETLTAASFDSGTTVPHAMHSLPVDAGDSEEFEAVRGKLLSMFDLAHFDHIQEVLIAGEVSRTSNGFFKFENEWWNTDNPELRQPVVISAEELWSFDVRPSDFKVQERKRRRQAALRWKGVLASFVSMAALLLLFIVIEIGSVKIKDLWVEEGIKNSNKPTVLDAMALLQKLDENKRGGIDPIGSLERIMMHAGTNTQGQANLWLTFAEFKSRYDVQFKGQGTSFQAVNDFFANLEQTQIVEKLKKEPKIDTLKTGGVSFSVDIQMLEEKPVQTNLPRSSSEKETSKVEG
jgi:hypothetical protein